MKRGLVLTAFLFGIFLFNTASASTYSTCQMNASLINHDPYPAVPGDYVKLVFQLTGVENPECQNIYFELMSEYPLSFDPGTDTITLIKAGTFVKDYNSFLMIPYKVRIDPDALNGDTPIQVRYATTSTPSKEPTVFFSKTFNLSVEDVRTSFDLFVKDYNPATNVITFEILNKGKSDVEALTLEIPKQENIAVKGPSTNIVGSLDSNDFTTADFEAVPSTGDLNVTVYYTDKTNTRRTLNKIVPFNLEQFKNRNTGKSSSTFYWILLVVVLAVGYYFYRRYRNKQKKKKLLK